MRLGEALKQRKMLIADIQRLRERLKGGFTYVEGDETYSKTAYGNMQADLEEKREALVTLKNRIAATNAVQNIQSLIIRRGELTSHIEYLKDLRKQYERGYSYGDEATKKRMTDASQLDSQIDKAINEVNEIDASLAKLNGSTDLIE